MAFSRTPPEPRPPGEVLTGRMVGIGMNFAASPQRDADIEATLVHASQLGMDDGDLRVLSALTTWLGVHQAHVNADRLVRLATAETSERVRAYWAAIASWLAKDRRFARLNTAYDGPRVELLPVGTDFQLKRRGEDPRFIGSKLKAPAGTLRDREDDVLTPEVLARRHAGYRNRLLIGPTWRADVWTVLERAPELSVAEVARQASCSFATAWQVVRDFKLLRSVEPRRTTG
jgi:hypothetical protein